MNFATFKNVVKNEIANSLGGGYTVSLRDTVKNNNVVLSGLEVRSSDENVSPMIYLEHYYEAYMNKHMDFEEVISDILSDWEKNRVYCHINTSELLNYDFAKHQIVYTLINTDKNIELLQSIPHIPFHDLSLVFRIVLRGSLFENASILIRNEHLIMWDITLDELFENARNNTPRINKYMIRSMEDVVRESGKSVKEGPIPPLFVLNNQNQVHGAACILYPNLIKNLSHEFDSNIYIIPSSIHEVLLLPTEKEDQTEFMKDMIREVNDTQVDETEILSYSLYYYDREKDDIIRL